MISLVQYAYALRAKIVIAMLSLMSVLLPVIAHADGDYLPPEKAFRFAARMADAKTVEMTFTIAKGYYLYRERFAFKVTGAQAGDAVIPLGMVKFDDTFQKNEETFRDAVTVRLPVQASAPFTLSATYQGCADAGLCYSPMTSSVQLDPGRVPTTGSAAEPADSEMGKIESSLNGGKLVAIVPLFLLLGLGLAFTPCVLPMMPILSSIILGDGQRGSRGRGFLLSVFYSLGMASIYTTLGVGAGLAGEGMSAALQNPWVLGAFALLMVGLSLSMFGLYQLQMPAAIQGRLAKASDRQTGGKLFGVFIMGAISALIVGPCVAAPLAGTLVFISQTRDVVTGGSALFAMAVGMSLPLLALGASAGALLPRAGAWMEAVKRFFGVLMLATALWMVSPVIPAVAQMLAWAGITIGYAIYLFRHRGGWMAKTSAVVFAGFGVLQLVGVATGSRDPLAPLAQIAGESLQSTPFAQVRSIHELNTILTENRGKVVMLDFYADWCVSCKEMETLTFTEPQIQAQFADMVLLHADVTANNENDRALLKRFGLFGPPGIIFFDSAGEEILNHRVIGYQNAGQFLTSLIAVNQRQTDSSTSN